MTMAITNSTSRAAVKRKRNVSTKSTALPATTIATSPSRAKSSAGTKGRKPPSASSRLTSKRETGGGGAGEDDIEGLFRFKGSEEVDEIRVKLLKWYDENKRDLPWRRIVDSDCELERKAYGVWVSEVMLQQTRVATVIDYYNRWMAKWPSVDLLSLASLEEVNEMWAGLGYYRRARYLLEGAKKIAEEGGEFPNTASDLKKIPGIGDYTSGAIASIAFKEAVPVVDGNVVRVLSRLKAISSDSKSSFAVKGFRKLAEQLVDPSRPGDFNQALMELGATLCTPTSPSCSTCPVSDHCLALSLSKTRVWSQVTDYPQTALKTKQRDEFSAVCVLEILESSKVPSSSNRQYLLVKRPEKGLLAGLWEFPSVLFRHDVDAEVRRKAVDGLLKKSFNLECNKSCNVISREYVGEYVHIFSHIRLKMYVEFLVLHVEGGMHHTCSKPSKSVVWKCVDSDDLSTIGLTSGVRKVYTMVQEFKQDAGNTYLVPCKSKKGSKG